MKTRQKGEIGPAILFTVVASLLVATIYMAYLDWKKWNQFKEEHHCKVVAQISGDTFTTVSSDGKVGVGSTDSKTGWLCDDGVTYYR